ncbi:MAG TPA: FecR family protein [Candidatus Binatia bacterium]|nr:FecR family protein [Candidatus Binatia bacterium]
MARSYARFFLRYFVLGLGLLAGLQSSVGDAASNKELQRLKGTIGYQLGDAGQFNQVAAKYVLPDDAFAVTQKQSAALLQLPDSSLVGLGQDTKVQVGAFNQTAAGPGSTITVAGGTLRFDIKRPQGGTANYRFNTPTSTIGVRGTVGLLAFAGGQTTVACLACAADSVTVTVGGQSFALATGQVITVTATGAVTTGAVTSATLSGFSSSGVSTSASSGLSAATAGVGGAVGGAAAPAAAAAAAGAGAIGGAAAASAQTKTSPAPNPGATQSGTIIIQQAPVGPAPAGPARRPF